MLQIPMALIADLASKEAQIRWIVQATPDEYLLPEELLNGALQFCSDALATTEPITAAQRDAVGALASAIDDAGDFLDSYDRSNIADLIERDASWTTIRERAAVVVTLFNGMP